MYLLHFLTPISAPNDSDSVQSCSETLQWCLQCLGPDDGKVWFGSPRGRVISITPSLGGFQQEVCRL